MKSKSFDDCTVDDCITWPTSVGIATKRSMPFPCSRSGILSERPPVAQRTIAGLIRSFAASTTAKNRSAGSWKKSIPRWKHLAWPASSAWRCTIAVPTKRTIGRLCPIVIKPQHYVTEEPVFSVSMGAALDRRIRAGAVGRLSHHVHLQTRTAAGWLCHWPVGFDHVAAAGPADSCFRGRRPSMSGIFRRVRESAARRNFAWNELCPSRVPKTMQLGYTIEEMAKIVEGRIAGHRPHARILRRSCSSWVTARAASTIPTKPPTTVVPAVVVRGGPNARAFAAMANEPRVRAILAERGLMIPSEVFFIGGFHNTCDDSIDYFDLDRLPPIQVEFVCASKDILRRSAAGRMPTNAADDLNRPRSRCLRKAALKHVENRSEDLSQVRPEYCHATNAVCIVGRRARTRGLFLDRRSFLTSYDPTIDDEQSIDPRGTAGGGDSGVCRHQPRILFLGGRQRRLRLRQQAAAQPHLADRRDGRRGERSCAPACRHKWSRFTNRCEFCSSSKRRPQRCSRSWSATRRSTNWSATTGCN